MKKIFTTKISLQSSNPAYSYPIIRLPRTLKDLAGETVSIYQTEKDGSLAFFVVPKVDKLDKFIEGIGQEEQEPYNARIDQKNPKTSGPDAIRTHDLRRVKAEDLVHAESFSHPSAALFDVSVGDTTTRNASAP